MQSSDKNFLIRVSYLEIYQETVRDLLQEGTPELKIHEDKKKVSWRRRYAIAGKTAPSVEVQQRLPSFFFKRVQGIYVDAEETVISDTEDILSLLAKGEKRRVFGATDLNKRSSRSHTIFRIIIESNQKDGAGVCTQAMLNLVDLAGAEGVRNTQAEGLRLKEGAKINQSLVTLGRVINDLAKQSGSAAASSNAVVIPYRDSKLTRVLQPSLSGNTKLAMICCICPLAKFNEQTKTTLSFASSAKSIKISASVNTLNEDGKGAVSKLKAMVEEADKLKAELEEARKLLRMHQEIMTKAGVAVPATLMENGSAANAPSVTVGSVEVPAGDAAPADGATNTSMGDENAPLATGAAFSSPLAGGKKKDSTAVGAAANSRLSILPLNANPAEMAAKIAEMEAQIQKYRQQIFVGGGSNESGAAAGAGSSSFAPTASSVEASSSSSSSAAVSAPAASALLFKTKVSQMAWETLESIAKMRAVASVPSAADSAVAADGGSAAAASVVAAIPTSSLLGGGVGAGLASKGRGKKHRETWCPSSSSNSAVDFLSALKEHATGTKKLGAFSRTGGGGRTEAADSSSASASASSSLSSSVSSTGAAACGSGSTGASGSAKQAPSRLPRPPPMEEEDEDEDEDDEADEEDSGKLASMPEEGEEEEGEEGTASALPDFASPSAKFRPKAKIGRKEEHSDVHDALDEDDEEESDELVVNAANAVSVGSSTLQSGGTPAAVASSAPKSSRKRKAAAGVGKKDRTSNGSDSSVNGLDNGVSALSLNAAAVEKGELEEKLQALQVQLASRDEEGVFLQSQLEEQVSRNDELQDRVQQLESALSVAEGLRMQTELQLTETRSSAVLAEEEAAKNKEAAFSLQQRLELVSAELDALKASSATALNAAVTAAEAAASAKVAAAVEQAKREHEEAMAVQAAAQKEALALAERAAAELRSQLEASAAASNSLKDSLSSALERAEAAENQLSLLNSAASSSSEENTRLINELSSQLSAARGKTAELEETLRATQAEFAECDAELCRKRDQVDSLEEANEKLQAQAAAMGKEIASLRADKESLGMEVDNLTQQKNGLDAQLSEAAESLDQAHTRLQTLHEGIKIATGFFVVEDENEQQQQEDEDTRAIRTISTAVETLTSAKHAAEQEAQRLNASVATLSSRLQFTEATLEESRQTIAQVSQNAGTAMMAALTEERNATAAVTAHMRKACAVAHSAVSVISDFSAAIADAAAITLQDPSGCGAAITSGAVASAVASIAIPSSLPSEDAEGESAFEGIPAEQIFSSITGKLSSALSSAAAAQHAVVGILGQAGNAITAVGAASETAKAEAKIAQAVAGRLSIQLAHANALVTSICKTSASSLSASQLGAGASAVDTSQDKRALVFKSVEELEHLLEAHQKMTASPVVDPREDEEAIARYRQEFALVASTSAEEGLNGTATFALVTDPAAVAPVVIERLSAILETVGANTRIAREWMEEEAVALEYDVASRDKMKEDLVAVTAASQEKDGAIAALQGHIQSLSTELEEEKAKVVEARQLHDAVLTESARLEAEASEVARERDELKAQLTSAAQEGDKAASQALEMASIKRALEAKQAAVDAANAAKEETEKSLVAAGEEKRQLLDALEASQHQAKALEERIHALNGQLQSLQEEAAAIAELRTRLSQESSLRQSAEAKATLYCQQNVDMRSEIAGLNGHIHELATQVRSLNGVIAQKDEEIGQALQFATHTTEQIEAVNAAKLAMEGELKATAEALKGFEASAAALSADREALEEQLMAVKEEIEKQRADGSKKEEEAKTAIFRFNSLQLEAQSLQATNERLNAQLADARTRIERLESSLHTAEDNASSAMASVRTLKEENAKAASTHAALRAKEVSGLKEQLQEMELQVDEMQEALLELKTEAATKGAQADQANASANEALSALQKAKENEIVMRAELSVTKQALSSAEAVANSRASEMAVANERLAKQKATLEIAEQEIAKLTARVNKLEKSKLTESQLERMATIAKEHKALKASVASLTAEKAQLAARLEAASSANAVAEGETMKRMREALGRAESTAAEALSSKARLEVEVEDLRVFLDVSRKDGKAASDEVARLQRQVTEIRASLDAALDGQATLSSATGSLAAALAGAATGCGMAIDMSAFSSCDPTETLAKAKDIVEKLSNALSYTQQELEHARSSMESGEGQASKRIAELEEALEEKAASLHQAEEAIEELEGRLKAVAEDISSYVTRIEDLERDLGAAGEKATDLERANAALETKLSVANSAVTAAKETASRQVVFLEKENLQLMMELRALRNGGGGGGGGACVGHAVDMNTTFNAGGMIPPISAAGPSSSAIGGMGGARMSIMPGQNNRMSMMPAAGGNVSMIGRASVIAGASSSSSSSSALMGGARPSIMPAGIGRASVAPGRLPFTRPNAISNAPAAVGMMGMGAIGGRPTVGGAFASIPSMAMEQENATPAVLGKAGSASGFPQPPASLAGGEDKPADCQQQ